jgi:hypothetical protein
MRIAPTSIRIDFAGNGAAGDRARPECAVEDVRIHLVVTNGDTFVEVGWEALLRRIEMRRPN